jgi:hypothetical protein
MSTVNRGAITNGLVLCLDAANPKSFVSGSTVWRDLTSNSNNGTLTNGPVFNSANGGSILLDAVDDVINIDPIPLSAQFFNKMTASIFFKPYDLTNTYNMIRIYTNNATFRLYRNAPGTNAGTLTWLLYYYNTSNVLTSMINYINFNIDEWASTSITVYDDGRVRFFKNGQLVIEKVAINFSFWDITPKTTPTLGFAIRQTNIASLQLYNQPLTDQEVLQNYNVTKTRFGL